MQPITIRKTSKFNVTQPLSITKGDKNFGSIAPSLDSSDEKTINGTVFKQFTGTLFNRVEENIDVEIDDTIRHLSEYQKTESFLLFYSEKKKLLLIFTGTKQAKTFVDQLQKNYPDDISLNPIDFKFPDISTDSVNNKALFFNVDDDHLDSMAAFGDEVDQNSSVSTAIDEKRATYLMAQMDIGTKSYTLGFSKKSALVIYQKLDSKGTDNPYLQLAVDTLSAIKAI